MADDADSSMTQDSNNLQPRDNSVEDAEIEFDNVPDDDDVSPEEFEELNSKMDELHSALDALEEQNDVIRAKLVELLESNRAARQQFKEEFEEKSKDNQKMQ